MNASTDACAIAYGIYRQLHPISREAINDRLAAQGVDGISQRTFKHLGKLYRYGCTEYLPINQLDVAVSQGQRP